ncbi:MAG: hypothetical protein DHS20C09_04190 [marine bacterium B5-7]|nr:MAG: hypothetical protein DHS20C09_04190 [marine bacterium B5-7]
MTSRYRAFTIIVITTLFLFGCNNVETRDAQYKNTSKYDSAYVRDSKQKYTSHFNKIKKTPRQEYLNQSNKKR